MRYGTVGDDPWVMEFDDAGHVVRMIWSPRYGPPRPKVVVPAPCPVHDRLTTPCEPCRLHHVAAHRAGVS